MTKEAPRKVSSNQRFSTKEISQKLARYSSSLSHPIAEHTKITFQEAMEHYSGSGLSSCILDAGCGTGESTYQLAKLHPESFILGIDRSLHRISKQNGFPLFGHNWSILRAEFESFFRLCIDQQFFFEKVYFLYPNPYPKKSQWKKRVPLNPVAILYSEITHHLECRTNWGVLAIEFAKSSKSLGFQSMAINRRLSADSPLSPFERKYAESNQKLFQVKCSRIATRQSPCLKSTPQ